MIFFQKDTPYNTAPKVTTTYFADFEEIENYLWDINHQYDFVDLEIIGYSHEDRPIYVLEIDHNTVS